MTTRIPLHLVTGHLGAGKTTLIKHFFSQKPPDAGDWLVLVNEFSALGVDGKILAGSLEDQDALLEVAGGCICCTAKLQLQQSLLNALRQRSFQRIFVEPTGLGLPQSLLEIFFAPEFAKILQVETIFCVLDAQWPVLLQQWADLEERMTLADVIVLNKKTGADPKILEKITEHLSALYPPKSIFYSDFAAVPLTTLQRSLPHTTVKLSEKIFSNQHLENVETAALPFIPLPWSGVLRCYQKAGALASFSWQWPLPYQFSLTALRDWQSQVAAYPGLQRVKGVFRLGQSYKLWQWAGAWQEDFIVYRRESILEIIADSQAPWAQWEKALRNCLL